MTTQVDEVESAGMTTSAENVKRGRAIKERRLALGIKSFRQFEAKAGCGRGTVAVAEKGDAAVRGGTYDAIEAALSRLEHEMFMDGPDLITSTIELPSGERVTFSGTDPQGVAEAVDAYRRARERDISRD